MERARREFAGRRFAALQRIAPAHRRYLAEDADHNLAGIGARRLRHPHRHAHNTAQGRLRTHPARPRPSRAGKSSRRMGETQPRAGRDGARPFRPDREIITVVYALFAGRLAAEDLFSATAARMSALNAFSSILSPSRKSMARLVLPSRLELKRLVGSPNEAPLAKVNFTTFLYVSPVQMIPASDHTG